MEGRRLRASGRSPAPPSGHPPSTLQPRPSPSSPSPLMRASSHLARTPRCLHTCRSSHTSARQVLSHVMRAINEAQVVPEAHPRPKANPADSHSAGHTAQPTPASRPLALPSLSPRSPGGASPLLCGPALKPRRPPSSPLFPPHSPPRRCSSSPRWSCPASTPRPASQSHGQCAFVIRVVLFSGLDAPLGESARESVATHTAKVNWPCLPRCYCCCCCSYY